MCVVKRLLNVGLSGLAPIDFLVGHLCGQRREKKVGRLLAFMSESFPAWYFGGGGTEIAAALHSVLIIS